MGTHRIIAPAAETATLEESRTVSGSGPGSIELHPVRAQDRHSMEPSANPARLRFGGDLLASTSRLARSRRVGSPPRTIARQIAGGRPDRFLTCGRRLIIGTGCWGGPKTGPNPTDRARPGSKHHIVTDAKVTRRKNGRWLSFGPTTTTLGSASKTQKKRDSFSRCSQPTNFALSRRRSRARDKAAKRLSFSNGRALSSTDLAKQRQKIHRNEPHFNVVCNH